MAWKLWLDDDLNNPDAPERHTPEGFFGAATSEEAIALVEEHGFENLELMDLDHDLGTYPDGSERTAKTFVKWLYENYPDGPVPDFRIHSKNTNGAPWLSTYLDSWRRSLNL